MTKSKKKVAVVGSGFGGLAAAIRLQSAGYDVTIFEKRDQPGGRAYVYRDQGFTFDAGPTVITAPDCLRDLFSGAGRKMEDYVDLIPVSPFYRLLWSDGTQFDYTQDLTETFAQIERLSPGDVEGYRRFLDYSKDVYNEGYTKLSAVPFLNFWSMVKVAPQLLRLKAYNSVYDTVSSFIKEEHLRQAFSFHSLLVGGNPFATSSIYTLIHYLERNGGVFFPRGGTGALVQGLIALFKEIGGKLVLEAELDEILTRDGEVTGVRLKDGSSEAFDLVVSNADVLHTYRHLLRHDSKTRFKTRVLEKMKQSMSLVVIYFGTNRTYPEIAHHTVLFGPRYKGLLDDIFNRGVLPEDFSLYLHAPTRTDPSLAPTGHEAFYVLSPVAHLGKLQINWDEEGPRYADKILEYLEKSCLPGLRESLVTRRIFTPQDFKTELNAPMGSAFSLEPLLSQSAYFRVHNREKRVRGLYFVGAGTHPGAGVPGVVQSAKATVQVIESDFPVEKEKTSSSGLRNMAPEAYV